jgi:formate hydrogenlyase subunit 6/NADH:ubiquinone oxidoreductase subunit I
MDEQNAYDRLIAHMRDWIIGMPDTAELRALLKERLSPEEAGFLAGLPLLPHTAEQLADARGCSVEALTARLDPLAGKGVVFRHESRGTVRYALNESMFMLFRSPFWAGRDDAHTRRLAKLSNRYFHPVYGREFGRIPTTGLRALPVQRTIADPRRIAPFEDIVQVLAAEEFICVAHCPCRQRNNLDPDATPCAHETLNCLHFGRLARYMVQQGMGRPIGHRAAEDLLAAAADAGLVHGISGHAAAPDSICNCCSCCCIYLQSVHLLGLNGHQRSNYFAQVQAQSCTGCGKCAERCPMQAVRLAASAAAANKSGKISVVDSGRCIGCGVCSHKCPTRSVTLTRRPASEDFPATEREMARRMARERGRAARGL